VTIETIDEGLALFGLNLLDTDGIAELAALFVSSGCDVLDMAALAHPNPTEHPADLRVDLQRAVALTGRRVPDRLSAAQTLKRICAVRGSTGKLTPRVAARYIKDLFDLVEAELPPPRLYLGDSFDISTLIGLYYSYDDIPFGDTWSARQVDDDLLIELARLAVDPNR
jgi:hypothetical protein